MKSNKTNIILILLTLSFSFITLGVTLTFFNYVKNGTTENSITSGGISFLYTEDSKIGRGILLEDAMPMTDEQGKLQTGVGRVFEFSITSSTKNKMTIPYEITARKTSDSTLDENAVKVYLEKGNEEVLLDTYDRLPQSTYQNASNYVEKVLYSGVVPEDSASYNETFKFRMWIDNDVDLSDGTYNNKVFKLTVNVYANGKLVNGGGNKYQVGQEFTFPFDSDEDGAGEEQSLKVEDSGLYKLEVWGAQGGNATYGSSQYRGGYGGYSTGIIRLAANDTLNVNVGEAGISATGSGSSYSFSKDTIPYNGGTFATYSDNNSSHGGGGGATDIRLNGSALEDRIIVAGAGGGAAVHSSNPNYSGHGGNGGGYIGNMGDNMNLYFYQQSQGGTQTNGGGAALNTFATNRTWTVYPGSLGQGGTNVSQNTHNEGYDGIVSGGGAGYYGGGAAVHGAGAGGSSYIADDRLVDKIMFGYDCREEFDNNSIFSVSTLPSKVAIKDKNDYRDLVNCPNGYSSDAVARCAKVGNGYAKITYLGSGYLVMFDTDKINDIPSVVVQTGKPIGTLPLPVKDGYVFDGWYLEKSLTTKINENYIPSRDVTVYAKWAPRTYTITLDKQGGSGGTSSVEVVNGEQMPNITLPSRSGYSFNGYYDTTNAMDLYINRSFRVDTNTHRIEFLDDRNGWSYTTADKGIRITAKFTITDSTLESPLQVQFNDLNIVSANVEHDGDTWTYYLDFYIIEDMVRRRGIYDYSKDWRFIDIEGIPTTAVVEVMYVAKNGKKYYDESGNGVYYADFDSDSTIYAKWN